MVVTGFTIIFVMAEVSAGGGVTTGGTIAADGTGAGTVTAAVALLVVSAVDVAVTVRAPGV